jgi:hypothetical protein
MDAILNCFFFWLYSSLRALAVSLKPSVSLQSLDVGQSVGLLGRVISSSQGLCLYTNTEKPYTQHKHYTSMSRVGFEPTVPASERARTVHVLDRSATVTGTFVLGVDNVYSIHCTCIASVHCIKR